MKLAPYEEKLISSLGDSHYCRSGPEMHSDKDTEDRWSVLQTVTTTNIVS